MQDVLNRIGTRELRLLIIGLGAIVCVGLTTAMVIPKAKAMIAAADTVRTLEAASEDGLELERHLQEKNQQIDELRFKLYGDMANLPVKQVEAYIIGRLQEISWATNIELVSVEPATGDRVQIFQEILFNVQLAGKYGDLYRWLWDVRSELGYVVVNEYSLTRKGDEDDDPELLAELSLASYRAVE